MGFRVFLLLDWLPNQGWKTHSALLFTHSWRENKRIHTFPKGISVCKMQSASSRIWTGLAVPISFDGNHYTTDTSLSITGCYPRPTGSLDEEGVLPLSRGAVSVFYRPSLLSVFFKETKRNHWFKKCKLGNSMLLFTLICVYGSLWQVLFEMIGDEKIHWFLVTYT